MITESEFFLCLWSISFGFFTALAICNSMLDDKKFDKSTMSCIVWAIISLVFVIINILG